MHEISDFKSFKLYKKILDGREICGSCVFNRRADSEESREQNWGIKGLELDERVKISVPRLIITLYFDVQCRASLANHLNTIYRLSCKDIVYEVECFSGRERSLQRSSRLRFYRHSRASFRPSFCPDISVITSEPSHEFFFFLLLLDEQPLEIYRFLLPSCRICHREKEG